MASPSWIRKMLELPTLMVLAVGLLIAAADPKEEAVKKEMAQFQGTWKFVSMEVEGKKKPDKDFNKYTVVLKGDQWTVSEGDKIAAQATFKLDPAKKPKTIDLTQTLAPHKGRLIRGIYSLEGDKLTVCDRGADKGERPTEFATKADSGLVLFVLKRAKSSGPKDDAGKKELAKFQGNWKFVSMEVNGKRSSEEEFGKFQVVYRGDGCKVYVGDKIAAEVTSIKLDPTKKPKTIDWTNQGRQIRGIYSLEGDRLTICDREVKKGDRPSEFATKPDSGLVLVVLKRVAPLGAGLPGRQAVPGSEGPPGSNWLELGIGEHEHALFRHHFYAQVLAQIQALIWDKPAPGQKGPLDVLDGTLVIRRGRRMWLDLSRVEKDTAAELCRLAAAKEPKDRLDLMTELRDHVAKIYYDRLAPYKSLADLQQDQPYRDNADYLEVPVDSDFFASRRVIYVAKDRVADALAAYADQGDRVLYPPGTAIIAEARDEKDGIRDTEVLWKRSDGYWTALIFDEKGKLVRDLTVERGKGKDPLHFTASFTCFACHRITREDISEPVESGFDHLERLVRGRGDWPKQVHLGPEYRERDAYLLTETELRQRDGVFGPYATLLLSELMYKQKHGTLSDADRCRYERLQPHFPQQLPPLAKKRGETRGRAEPDRIAAQPAIPTETPDQAWQRHAKVAERRKGVDVICHRGPSEFAHENTLEAYRATFELGGDGNEFDIRATKDSVLILFHDPMLDRLLEAYGDVSDYTWEELQRFRFRSPGRFGEQCRIPTLVEVFDLHRKYGGLMHLDIKQPGLDQAIADLLTKMDMWDQVAYCNVENGGVILRDSRLKLRRYKATGLYLDRSEVFPDAIAAALKKSGDGVIVDDPRGVAVALGRKLGKLSKEPVSPREMPPRKEEAKRPSEAELIAILRKADDWDRVAETAADKAASAQRIRVRAEAAEQLLAAKASSKEAFAALEERVRKRSLYKDWRYHGLDGAMALRSLILLRAPNAIETARFALWRDDPALEPLVDPRWKNPRAWTDFRVKMVIWPALEKCPDSATEKLCRDYLTLNDEDALKLGPPQFEEAAKALLAVSPKMETALELMKHRLRVVCGQAILECLARAKEPFARAALERGAPHALAYLVDD